MARQFTDSIRKEADEFAQQLDLPEERVRRIFERVTAAGCAEDSPPAEGEGGLEFGGTNLTLCLGDALASRPVEEVLRLFESCDLGWLDDREAATRSLWDVSSLQGVVRTHEMLQSGTQEFSRFLQGNREALIETGNPAKTFKGFNLLDYALNRQFPTKNPEGGHAQRDADGNWVWRWKWYDREGRECSYDRAPYIPDLRERDIKRLERMRSPFLDLKLSILRMVARSLDVRSSECLWEQCLNAITDIVTGPDADFLLQSDLLYMGYAYGPGESRKEEAHELMPGGLTDLFEVIGYYEKEIRIGTYARTAEALVDYMNLSRAERPRFGVSTYFEVLGQPHQAAFDSGLDLYRNLLDQEALFWDEYEERVNTALEGEFYEEIVHRNKIRRKHAERYRSRLRSYSEYLGRNLERKGDLPPHLYPGEGLAEDEATCRFRREADSWALSYSGKTVSIKHSKGMNDLACLLSQPYEWIRATALIELSDGAGIESAARTAGHLKPDALAQMGLHLMAEAGGERVVDKEGIATLLGRYQELKLEEDSAVRDGDLARQEAARAERLKFQESAKVVFGLRGARHFPSARKKLKDRVVSRINRCLDHIDDQHEALGLHLRGFLTLGFDSRYHPEKLPPWEF